MTKLKSKDKEEFTWKFRIYNTSPVFKEINDGTFQKIGDGNVYTCDEEHQDLAQQYITEGKVQLYTSGPKTLIKPSKRYVVEDGRFMMYENKMNTNAKNESEVWKEFGRDITENFYIVIDENVEFDDGMTKTHRYRGRVIVNNGINEFEFDEDAKSFSSNLEMGRVLSDIGGADVIFADNAKEVRAAMQSTSEYKSLKVSLIFGWHGNKIYHTPSTIITKDGVISIDNSEVDLSDRPRACNLDILTINDNDFKKVGEHICEDLLNVHDRYVVDCLFGFTFLAPIASKIVGSKKWSGGRIGMWLVGSSGCGKSHTSQLFQCFFGNFAGEGKIFGWGGTSFSVQDGGYYFKDALFLVDDFKIAEFSGYEMPNLIKVLQNYAEGTSRTRYNMNLGHADGGKPIRGSMLITGEDILDDVASIMTRYHVVRIDDTGMNESSYNSTKDYTELYSGFMGRYIAWLLSDPKSVEKIVGRIEKWKSEIIVKYPGININRIAQSFAYNLVGFDTFCRFLEENKFISMEKHIEMAKIHKNNLFSKVDPHIEAAREATVAEVFISTLRDLLNSGSVHIHTVKSDSIDEVQDFREEYIGFDASDPDYLYFFGTQVLNAVNAAVRVSTGSPLRNTKTNLTGALIEMEAMEPTRDEDGGIKEKTFRKKLYGKTQVTWRISKKVLGYDFVDLHDKAAEFEYDEDW